jgi:hypothetical protein
MSSAALCYSWLNVLGWAGLGWVWRAWPLNRLGFCRHGLGQGWAVYLCCPDLDWLWTGLETGGLSMGHVGMDRGGNLPGMGWDCHGLHGAGQLLRWFWQGLVWHVLRYHWHELRWDGCGVDGHGFRFAWPEHCL